MNMHHDRILNISDVYRIDYMQISVYCSAIPIGLNLSKLNIYHDYFDLVYHLLLPELNWCQTGGSSLEKQSCRIAVVFVIAKTN